MPMDDSRFWPKGAERCKPGAFLFWMAACLALGGWAAQSATLCLWKGLNQTAMNDFFAFGVWIVVDLAVIALGAGAFFTGFMTYVLRREELKNIINAAVIIGFICYSGAILMLGIDIGQPLRGWFGFWHANVHSMLTEVMFCITTYLIVLIVEFVPLVLENRQFNKVPDLSIFAHHLHRIMIVFASTGTFLSFFHQGSLGGMFGVLYARPFAFREGIAIWPWTFFLFILSAIASGPSFTTLVVMLTEKVSGRQLTSHKVKMMMGKVSAYLLTFYFILKGADTLWWANVTLPRMGVNFWDLYQGVYGTYLVWLELGLFCAVPAFLLLHRRVRESYGLLALAMILNCMGAITNRFVFTIQPLAIPVMPFDKFQSYWPTIPEWGISFGVIAYGLIIFSLAYRYLPVFPQEAELNK
ncbi:MAG: menaquinone reductase integral membrane subunit QrcD [Pseudomonadota bacterium]